MEERIRKVKEAFERNQFSFAFFETVEQAAAYLAEQVRGKTVTFGGSMTLKEMHADEVLGADAEVRWHWNGDAYCQDADVYITSANALSEQGAIVNIDGACNRVAGQLFGAPEVFVVCGVNKLAPDLHAALHRAQNVAAPKNAQRLGVHTPCAAKADRCYHCVSPERICSATVIVERPPIRAKRYEIVLINQDLGY
ncbi:MAG: lactate utilization protein [Butyricicoccaceae bacterium]